jgi:hypothetical protein
MYETSSPIFTVVLFAGGHKDMSSDPVTNSTLVSKPNAGGGVAGSQPMSTYSGPHGAQINIGDLTPYLTYACLVLLSRQTVTATRREERPRKWLTCH